MPTSTTSAFRAVGIAVGHPGVPLDDALELAVAAEEAGLGLVAAGEGFAEIETVKTTIVLYAPVGGEVVEVNPDLDMSPELVNQDPYGAGWLAVFRPADWEAERATLLDPERYLAVMRQQAEEELNRS